MGFVGHLLKLQGSLPSSLTERLIDTAIEIVRLEELEPIEPIWSAIEYGLEEAVAFRALITRRRRWAMETNEQQATLQKYLLGLLREIVRSVPHDDGHHIASSSIEVPLIDLVEQPSALVTSCVVMPFAPEATQRSIFDQLRRRMRQNLLVASGLPPTAPWDSNASRVKMPIDDLKRSPPELVEAYLAHTPLQRLLEAPVTFRFSVELRFEHCHIIGGTGHGKTQLMQSLIHADLASAKEDGRAVVVIDSQGDLISKLSRLALFDPAEPNTLADRLIIIDPSDVEFPASLNLFDAHLDRLSDYRPVDRERVLNGVVELYERFFGDLLGAELTQKQGVIFKYLARLLLTIPGATIHTLMQLMENGKPFRSHMEQLDGSARYFFQTEFFHPSFAATKRQILKRLWGVLSTPAFERMFAQKPNKLDLFQALQDGKIILINTAKELLKEEGSQLFGRFFLALLTQAALERSTIAEKDRTPTFVYVDEAQEYFDDRIETILNQARKYRVGLTLAHQTLDQLSPRLRSAIHANTSMKCAGGVSARDARALADELHTTSDFIESMRRRGGRTEFAVWLKNQTPHAIRLTVPLGFLEGQPILTQEGLDELIATNRERYCGTLADVLTLTPTTFADPDEPKKDRRASEPQAPEHVAEAEPPLRSERTEPPPPRAASTSPRPPPTPGKGGSQHKYLQQLVKQLAEERGLRAVIEEGAGGGQVDVGLHQGDLSIACEISVTSKSEYEAQSVAKCLRAGFGRVWVISPDARRRKAIKALVEDQLPADDLSRVEFLTPEELVEALDNLAIPEPDESVVKGYRVKTSRKLVSPSEAKERRSQIARILSQSTRDSEP